MKKKIMATLLLLVFMHPVQAAYLDYACGGGLTVKCMHDLNGAPVMQDCDTKCAQAKGENTNCLATALTNCEDCCTASTCGSYGAYSWLGCLIPVGGATQTCACYQACIGSCEINTRFCDTIKILRIVAAFAGAAIIAMMGLKWLTSEDAQGRDEARKGIWYVIIGGIIIIVASYLVGYLYVGTIAC